MTGATVPRESGRDNANLRLALVLAGVALLCYLGIYLYYVMVAG